MGRFVSAQGQMNSAKNVRRASLVSCNVTHREHQTLWHDLACEATLVR